MKEEERFILEDGKTTMDLNNAILQKYRGALHQHQPSVECIAEIRGGEQVVS